MSNTTRVSKIDIDQLTAFKNDNENFELQTFNFWDQTTLVGLAQEGEAGITEEQLKGLQRLLDLTQDETYALNLYNAGLASCFQVAALSQQQFIAQYQAAFGGSSALAAATHQRALARQSQLMHHYLNIRTHHEPHYKALHAADTTASSVSDKYGHLPSYQDEFGSLDYCQVEPCRSIFSPAAYLLDLIRFKEKQIDDSGVGNEHKLAKRRPDLNDIPLDGEHTDTAIPKLEIVNKVLVNKVKLDNEETPTEDQVYQALTQKIYPFTLPFHWPLTQIRAYLVMLKTDLPTIWRTLDINASSAHLIAQETLAISPQEFTLYTTPKTDKSSIQAAYGLGSSDPLDEDEGLKNIDVFLKKTGLTREALSQLLHGDLSDEEIETGLNKPFFINEGTEPAIDIDKDDKHLTNLTLPRLDRIHRFIRLAKKTGWSFVDLDWVLRLGGNSIEQALPLLAQLKTWQKAYQQPIHILSALIGNIRDCGKAAGQSFFDTIFLQLKTTITLPDRSTQWSIQGDQEANLSIKSLLEGALDISPAVLQAIAAKVGDIMHADETKLPLGLSELSALYRLTLCAQLLKRPVEAVMDLLRWMAPQDNPYTKALIGDSPAVVQTKKAIEALNKLADLSQTLQTGGVSIEALTCILGDPVPLDSPHYLSPDSQKNFIQELYHATQPTLITKSTIQAHPELPQIDKEGNSFDLLAKLKECNAIDNQGIVLKKSLIGSELEQLKEHFYTSEQLAKTLHSFLTKRYKSQQELQKNQPDGQSPLSFSAATLEKTLDQYVNEDLHKINEHAIQSIPDLPKLDKEGANFDLLAKLKEWKIIDDKGIVSTTPEKDKLEEQLKQYFYTSEQLAETLASFLSHHQKLQTKILADQLATLFAVAPETIPEIARWAALSCTAGKSNTAVNYLQVLYADTLTPEVTQALQNLNSYACLTKTLSLTHPELQSIMDHPACYNILDSQHLTLQDIAHLAQYKHLVNTYQDKDYDLVAYFAKASSGLDVSKAAQALAKLMQRKEAPLQTLLDYWWPADADTPSTYGTVAGLVRLQQCFELSQQLGLSIASLKALQALADQAGTADANYPAYTQAALNLLSAVKAQYNDTAWTTVYEPIQVTLNEAKRNSLADLVSYQSQLDTPRDLYEYLLIDVEVSGVVKTSKIKEAIGCLQLYINRCRMNLEPSIAFYDRADLERNWAWIKNYRVWEANRKTFLYPENYIQPELRQDKTELFQQLTESLQQTHIDPESVTKAVHGYLDRFAEVANLKYAGSYINFFNFNQWGSPSTVSGAQLTNNASTVVFQGKLYCFYHSSSSNNNSIYYSYTTDPSRDSWTEKQLKVSQGIPQLATGTSPAVTVLQGKLYCFYHGDGDNTIWYSYTSDPSRDSWTEKQLKVSQGIPQLATGTSPAVTVLQDKLYCFYHGDGDNTIWYSYTSDPSRDSWTEKSLEASQGAPQLATGTSPAVTVLQDKLCCFYHGLGDNTIWYSYTSDPSSNSWTKKQLKAPGNPQLATGTSPAVTVLQDKLYCFCHGLGGNTIWYSYTTDPSRDSWTEKQLQDSEGEHPTLAGSPNAVAFNGRLYCFYNYNQELHYNFLYADNATLFLLNRTHTQPYQYYYRQADFTYDASQQTYNNPQWKPWTKINLTIPAQFASPIYAFGKLFVFWAEIKPAPADRNPAGSSGEAGKAKNKRFEATLHYSFYQFNKDWVAPQTVGEAISLPNTVTQAQTEQVVWQRVHVALVGEQLIVRYPQAVSGTRVTQSFQWAIDINLNASSRTDSGGYETTLPLPNQAFTHLPTGTKYYPVSNSNLSILDTGKSAYLGIPQGKEQSHYIRLNSTTIHALSHYLFAQGIEGLLSIPAQLTPEDSFTALGPQAAHVAAPYPAETLDFGGADGLYYWEVFFHTPFLVANQFNTHQQFELAQQWYQYLYNPTIDPKAADPDKDASEAEHYWRFVGLRSSHNPTLKKELQRSPSAELEDELQATAQLRSYHEDPFDPHAIAALRPIAYQKTLVMHYIDNLLDWGDDLFRQDTRETLVEATMHYVTAWDLMGKKPTNLGPCTLPHVQTLEEIREHDGGNIPEFLLDLENQLRALPLPAAVSDNPNNAIANIYFGIPENDQFIAYWDRVQGRLYNIRHNLTLDGKPNYLPLFQPPINPMQLIQAIAAGAGVSSALAALQAPVPHYRFTVMLDKAKNATNFVIQLGSSLLQALEKKDAEQLALLRTTHEQALLTLTRITKQDQQKAAQATVEALTNGVAGAQARLDHYSDLITKGLSAGEQAQLTLEASALASQGVAQGIRGAAIAGHLVPTVFGFADGDFKPGDAINQGAMIADGVANMLTQSGNLAATIAQYQRRAEDWQLQQVLAQEDVSQIGKQLEAAKLQVQIADQELQVLEQNITQTQEIAQLFKTKFSNQDQYLWMVGQLAALYFQAYQLAHQLAVAAQRAWQFEKAHEQSLIQPGYWNDLHKGLLAGEGLMLGLMLLEKAYMDQDARRLEIVKTISLNVLDSGALAKLKKDGTCTFDLDEKLFDHDYPGHYSRQIKTLSLSFPAVLGPYQNIHATLTQTSSKTVLQPDASTIKSLLGVKDAIITAGALRTDGRANQQIALSQGVNDSGLFELTFQDARYLPFEGTGAVSSWQLAIPPAANPNVLATLTDVIITLHYTALAGDAALQQTIVQEVYKDGSTGQ